MPVKAHLVTVLIADDDPIVRQAVRSVLALHSESTAQGR